MGDIETDVAILNDWRIKYADPTLEGHGVRLMNLEDNTNSWKGSLKVIVWLNGIILGLVVALIITLFGWGLSHITLRVENTLPNASQLHQDAANPELHYQGR